MSFTFIFVDFLIMIFSVNYGLPDIDLDSDISFDFLSSDAVVHDMSPSPNSSHAILHDMFLSRCVTGIRVSILHCSEHHLRFVCSLHGLDINHPLNLRDMKLKLLYHTINSDCFANRCEKSRPLPDCSACLRIATGFSSSLSITKFIIDFFKGSTALILSVEDLLLIVESTGNQLPYNNVFHLRWRVFTSLDEFYSLHHQVALGGTYVTIDPYGDLFMGFEDKRRTVLESVMNHHGLLSQEKKLSIDEMRNIIVSHIAFGHCAHPVRPSSWNLSRIASTMLPSHCSQLDESTVPSCDDFVRDATLNDQFEDSENEIKIMSKILEKVSSRRLLFVRIFLTTHHITLDGFERHSENTCGSLVNDVLVDRVSKHLTRQHFLILLNGHLLFLKL